MPHQSFAYTTGKNASDIALVIDAMDLLHDGRFDGFCLVSSDSDFTRLAARIREEGVDVYGFGEQKTPASFLQACRRFIYTENSGARGCRRRTSPSVPMPGPPHDAAGHSGDFADPHSHRPARGRERLGAARQYRPAARDPLVRFRFPQLWKGQARRPGRKDRRVRRSAQRHGASMSAKSRMPRPPPRRQRRRRQARCD